jgi:penicillin G amidase
MFFNDLINTIKSAKFGNSLSLNSSMKYIPFLTSLLITIALIVVLGSGAVLQAPLAKLLSPQHGIWQNAEPVDMDYNAALHFSQLKNKGEVYLDERMVPHIFAENDADAFFMQGYLHAKFRLWQMEFQTHAAAGRLCEILGPKSGETDLLNAPDRFFRRLGMGYAAEKSLEIMEADPAIKTMCDAYTAGINAYINSLTESSMPIEYKLLGYKPEPWTNLKSALFMKYMAFDLAGYEQDFEYTAARNSFSRIMFEKMLPIAPDSLDPIIQRGTLFGKPGILPITPAGADSLYFNFQKDSGALPVNPQRPDKENGSNNWALSGKKTKSGYPILCNDPHLGLNLPSLWYEAHIQTPDFNVYGASFPCSPGVAIGFNDSCAFGFTNAGRDVRDYYEIKFKDASRSQYWFNGEWKATKFRIERIKIKGKPDYTDSVAYTVFGPVMYDASYANHNNDGKNYAVRWKAHDPSNEVSMFYQLNRAKNYNDYLNAIKNLHTPGQNCVFAAKNGDIALWCQGEFPAKWRRQGDFVMPGTDSSYMWKGMIPQEENPHMINPERGFVSSANQVPVDATYPYYLGGSFPNYRGSIINRKLNKMQQATPQDMMQMQNDNYNVFAEMAAPMFMKYMNEADLGAEEKKYWDLLKAWNLRNEAKEKGKAVGEKLKGAVVFKIIWGKLENLVWNDEMKKTGSTQLHPHESTLLEGLLKDSAFEFVDDITTPQRETLPELLVKAVKESVPDLKDAEAKFGLDWAAYKGTRITHLTRIPSFNSAQLPIGGGQHIINATKTTHGPSWRMIVHLTPETEAYGVYPGGQNGNPGSKYYDTFINSWVEGKYYPLWVMKKTEANDKRVKYKMSFGK